MIAFQGFASPANATPREAPPATTTTFFSLAEQHEAEQVVERFSSTHPMPELAPGSSADAYDAFQGSLEVYWSSVPWESVFAQWDCRLTSEPTVRRGVAESGMPFVAVEEAHECGDPEVGAEFAGLVESRGTSHTLLSPDGEAGASPTLKCSSASGDGSACVEPVRQGPVRASGTNLRNAMSLARVRAGQSTLTSCTAGTQITVGGYGTWASGQTKSLTFSVNQNDNWSSTYQRETGLDRFANVATACELI